MLIRSCKMKDIPQILAIENRCFSDPWSEKLMLEYLELKNAEIFVAEKEKIVGFLLISYCLDEGNIDNIAVLPEYQGMGIAKHMIENSVTKLNFLSKLMLEVRSSNEPAISLYRKLGFRKDGIRKNYYKDPVEDGVLMTKYLGEENENISD